jgi:hypothetical protein
MEHDPYRPPAHLDYTQPAQTEDAVRVPKVLGVFSIVFAIVTLVLTSLFLYVYTAFQGMNEADVEAEVEVSPTEDEDVFDEQMRLLGEAFDLEMGLIQASSIGLMVMSAALIVLGVGQRRYRRWARIGSLIWAGLGLGLIATAIAYSYAVVQPAWEAILDGALTGDPEGRSADWTSVLKYVLFIPYPIVMILVCVGPRVSRAMSR